MAWTRRRRPMRLASWSPKAERTTGSSFSGSPATSCGSTAILECTDEVKWAAAFLRLATQVISKDESLDHRSYTGKIRDMLEEHVHATGLSTTIRLRSISDPDLAD